MTTDRTEALLSIEEFERLPDDEWPTELVRGRLVREPPAGMDHGRVEIRLAVLIANFADRHALGDVFSADTGYVLFEDPPTVRVPDVSFVSVARLPSPEDSIRFGRMAPDLAVEVISPSNTATEIIEKIADYLNAGTRLLWIVEPRRRCVTVHRADEVRLLREGDELEGYEVLPGFSVPVARIFTGSPGTGRPSPEEPT
jgi:Uma2 family endonuclease